MRSRCLLSAFAACLLLPAPSFAGGYAVTACFGWENSSWSEWEPSRFATAYTACPGGVVDVRRPHVGDGMMVRNVVGPQGRAPLDAAAALRFDAPAGTTITGLDADLRMTANPGWDAGIHDATNERWLWCGPRCLSSFSLWIHEELRGLATQRVQALVRCAAPRCQRNARHGFLAMRNVRVYLEDPAAPRVEAVRGGLISGAWLRGEQDAAFDAADNSGIRVGRIELDGRAVHEHVRECDFTRPVPCSDGAVGAWFDTRAWADGEHVLRLAAQDAGGNWATTERVVRVDNTPPAEPVPMLDGGDAWNPSRTRSLALPLPGGQAAPLTRARVKACRVGGPCDDSAPELGGGIAAGGSSATAAVPVTAFDGPGEYTVRVALEDAAGNVGPFAGPLTMRFDDARPGAPDVSAADAWRNGGALPLATTGDRPVSGIRGYRVRIGGREAVVATSVPLDELPEGGTPVEVSAISGAGLEGTAVRTTLKLDRSRPVVAAEGAPDGWSREAVRLELRGRDQPGLSGVRSLAWRLDGGEDASGEGEAASVEIAGDGRHTVSFRAIDGAANSSAERAVAVKVDRTAPETVAFEAPDPADPRRVRVVVADRMSGVASGRIDLRPAGGEWRAAETAFEGDRLVTLLDDATLPAGPYELRAVVRDVAGNEAVGSSRVDGAPAALTLPLRRVTTLSVRRAGRLLQARLSAGGEALGGREVTLAQRLRGRARWRNVCARRTLVVAARAAAARAPISRLAKTAAAASRPPGSQPAVTAVAAGSARGSRSSAVASTAGACTLRTDGAGRLEVRLPRGPSRTVRLEFAGDALHLPARGTATLRTPVRARLRATPRRVRAGGAVRLSGRLLGGHIPRAGKLVELQARVGADWRTFATVRSDHRGQVRYVHRFAAASAGRRYLIRLRVRRETAYPFETGTSRAVAVRVV